MARYLPHSEISSNRPGIISSRGKTVPPNMLHCQFDELGFVVRDSFFNPSEIQSLQSELNRVLLDVVPHMPSEHVFYERKTDPTTLKQLQRLHQHDPFFERLISKGPVRDLAEQLLNQSAIPQNLQYFNKPPSQGLPTPPHQDGFYFKLNPCHAVTLWLALDPVDEQTGCLRYIRGSHRRGLRPHGGTGTLGFSQGITDFPSPQDSVSEIACPAKPGDLIAHDALTIHRADGNTSQSRSRRALGFIYYGVNAKEDRAAWNQYQHSLNQTLKQQGRI